MPSIVLADYVWIGVRVIRVGGLCVDGRLDGLDGLSGLCRLSVLRIGVALRSRGLCRSIGRGTNSRCRGGFGSRCSSGGDSESLPAKLVVQSGTRNTMIIRGCKFQEADCLLHQTLGRKKVRIFEITIIQGRKLVRLCCRVRPSTSPEIFIHVFHGGAEYGDLLDEGLQCTCMSRVSGPFPSFVLSETVFILR